MTKLLQRAVKRNPARGFAILSAKDGQEALLAALHDEDLVISGDFVEMMWFQGLTEYLQPEKAQAISPIRNPSL